MTRLFFLCSITMMRLRQSRGVIKSLKKIQKESLFSKIQHIVYIEKQNNLLKFKRGLCRWTAETDAGQREV